jgi:hypothetical protein
MDVKKQELIDMVLRYTTNLIIQFNGKGSLTVEKSFQVQPCITMFRDSIMRAKLKTG